MTPISRKDEAFSQEKVRVFEVRERGEIRPHRNGQQRTRGGFPPGARTQDPLAEPVVEDNGRDQQRRVLDAPVSIERK